MQWRDRAAKAGRQARLAMSWGAQMALYPVYVLFQSTRLAGYQLRQAVTRLMPLLEAVKEEDFDPQVGAPRVNSDEPIHNTLAYLDTLELPVILSPWALAAKETARPLPGTEHQVLKAAEDCLEGWIYPAIPLQFDVELQRSLSLNLSFSSSPDCEAVRQMPLSSDASRENSVEQTEGAIEVAPQSNALVKTAGMAIALTPEWEIVIPPSTSSFGWLSLPPEPLAGELVSMDTEIDPELTPLVQHKQVSLQRAIARLREAVVPVHDSTMGTVDVTQIVRGVACVLATQSLVLVSNQNQVLDVLTPMQQLRLHQQIVFETATYYRRYHLQIQAQRAEIRSRVLSGKGAWRFLPPPRRTRKTLPPVRAFQSLMEWVQKSPVAIATNLFQESVLVIPDSAKGDSSHALSGRGKLISLPSASLPSPAPPPAGKRSFWQDLLDSLRVNSTSGSDSSASASSSNPTHPIAPQRWFDPDYQSGEDGFLNANAFVQSRQQAEAAPAVPSLPRRSRWMPDWASTFFNSGDSLDIDLADEEQEGGAIAPASPSSLGRNPRFPNPNDVLRPDWPSGTTAQPEWDDTELALERSSVLNRNRRHPDEKSSLAVDEKVSDSLVPTTVETPATLVGYVKHPLEHLLEWIDVGMVWIENVVDRMWSWLSRSN